MSRVIVASTFAVAVAVAVAFALAAIFSIPAHVAIAVQPHLAITDSGLALRMLRLGGFCLLTAVLLLAGPAFLLVAQRRNRLATQRTSAAIPSGTPAPQYSAPAQP